MDLLNTVMSMPMGAYLDPSSVSILVTSLSGIVIAVGTTAIILWRRAKKKVSKALHIDENAHKEVEDDVVLNTSDSSDDSTSSDQ